MIFEKWREKLRHLRSTKNLASLELTNCIADWKAEREKLIGALEKIFELLKVHPEQIKKAAWRYKIHAIVQTVLAEVKGEK